MDASFTFDTNSGVGQVVNQTINTGANFIADYAVTTTSGAAFNFSGYSFAGNLTKSVSIGSSMYALRTFSISESSGTVTLSLSSANTIGLKEGRYKYDVLAKTGSTTYRLVEGDVMVRSGVTSSV